jgi:hypothetical protein
VAKFFTEEYWTTPEGQAAQEKRFETSAQRRREDPWAYAPHWGIPARKPQFAKDPTKHTKRRIPKREAVKQWKTAQQLADKFVEYLKETDQAPSDMKDVKVISKRHMVPHVDYVVPDSDEEKAVVALREAFLLAIGPTALPEKLKAINTVLMYTKTKPESSTKLRVEKAEDFLDLIADVRATDDDAEAD